MFTISMLSSSSAGAVMMGPSALVTVFVVGLWMVAGGCTRMVVSVGGGVWCSTSVLAGLGWQGHSPAEGADLAVLLVSPFFLPAVGLLLLWKVNSTFTRSFPSASLHRGAWLNPKSRSAFFKITGTRSILVSCWLVFSV